MSDTGNDSVTPRRNLPVDCVTAVPRPIRTRYRRHVGRDLRVIDPTFPYHLISRGNNGGQIVFDRLDVDLFVTELGRVATKHRFEVWAWCLMTNHYHLVLRAPYGGLSEGMQALNGNHGRRMNGRHGRTGHLVQNRYFSVPLEADAHAVTAVVYVVNNPVKAGLSQTAAEWPASSYRATAGLESAPAWLAVEAVRALFGRDSERAIRAYRDIVHRGHLPVSDTIEAISGLEPPAPRLRTVV